MDNMIIKFVLDHVVKQKFLDGYHMYFSGASGILGGLVIILDMLATGHMDYSKLLLGWGGIAAGYAVIGSARKQDAALAVAKVNADANVATAEATQATAEATQKVADQGVVVADAVVAKGEQGPTVDPGQRFGKRN